MNKKTEIVKSIILTLLVAMSVVLFANSWISQWDFEGGRGIIGRISARIGIFGDSYSAEKNNKIISPSSVVLTSGAKRIILNKGTEEFSSVYGDILSVFSSSGQVLSEVEEITEQQWFYAQKNHSVLLDFGSNVKSSVVRLGSGCYVPDKVENLRYIILTTNGSATNKLVFYYFDAVADKYYLQSMGESAEKIDELLNSRRGYKNIPLAAELGFNAKPEEGYGQQITIGGNVPIILESEKSTPPAYKNINNAVSALDNRKLNKLLKLFGMSVSSANRYADKNGMAMYVDTQGTLKFYDDGKSSVIEYEAANSSKGAEIELSGETNDVLYDMTGKGYQQVFAVCEFFEIAEVTLSISSDITDDSISSDGEFRAEIDYYLGGIPVYFAENNKAVHPAEVKFNSKGNLIYYKQRLYNVTLTDGNHGFPEVMEAINKLSAITDMGTDIIEVERIFPGYLIEDNTQIKTVWCIKIKGNNETYIVK